jgi:hypothetical protein
MNVRGLREGGGGGGAMEGGMDGREVGDGRVGMDGREVWDVVRLVGVLEGAEQWRELRGGGGGVRAVGWGKAAEPERGGEMPVRIAGGRLPPMPGRTRRGREVLMGEGGGEKVVEEVSCLLS